MGDHNRFVRPVEHDLHEGVADVHVSTWNAAAGGEFAVWAWAAARESYPADVDTFTPDRLRDLVAGHIADWSPALRTMPTLPHREPSAVTLLGDAVHNMTPMAGIGANTALRDADTLRRALLGPGPLVEQVGRYEEQMRGYANRALAVSTRNARNAAAPTRLPAWPSGPSCVSCRCWVCGAEGG